MVAADFRAEPLGPQHHRAAFSCGVEALDRYLRQQATQDERAGIACCFVLVHGASGRIAGYYTLSAHAVALHELPAELVRRLPRYPLVPSILLGRLAVDERYRGQGIGRLVLFSALHRALAFSREVGAYAVVVEAKDEAARAFYLRHDFLPFPSDARRLFLPMRSIERAFSTPV